MQCSDNFMFPALIVGGRTEAPRGSPFELNAVQEAIEGEIEVESGLLTICDDIQSRCDLVVNGDRNCVIDQLSAIIRAELIEMSASEFQPTWKRIAADDGRSQRMIFHEPPSFPSFS